MGRTELPRVEKTSMAKTVHDFTIKSLTGEEVSLSQYKGKVILIENVASL